MKEKAHNVIKGYSLEYVKEYFKFERRYKNGIF